VKKTRTEIVNFTKLSKFRPKIKRYKIPPNIDEINIGISVEVIFLITSSKCLIDYLCFLLYLIYGC
jgi:hypothetical protein